MISVVYPYLASETEGDELQISMDLFRKNVKGDFQFVLVGDVPAWYTGMFIDCPRLNVDSYFAITGQNYQRRWLPWVDVYHKALQAASSSVVSDTFVWMYDDTFVTRETNIEYFLTARHVGPIAKKRPFKSEFQTLVVRGRSKLELRGKPICDFGTHHPYPIEKSSFLEFSKAFNSHVSPCVLENLYLNWCEFPCEELKPEQFLYCRMKHCHDRAYIEKAIASYSIVNFAAVTNVVRDVLEH